MSIPLTFDWLTLAWLKTRLHLWWRVGRASPRQLALLLVLGLFSGCVPVTRFEETQSAAQVEMEGRRRSEYQVAQLQKELAELRQRMQQQSQTIDERDQALSQAQLDSSTLGKQREDADGVVAQLRANDVAVQWVPGCTRESEQLYSYRRDGRTGRFAGVVQLVPA